MASNETNGKPDNFVFTAEALQKTPPSMGMATRAIHADDFLSPHHAISPAIHVTVCYRYPRNPDNLVPKVTDDLNAPFDSHADARGLDAPALTV